MCSPGVMVSLLHVMASCPRTMWRCSERGLDELANEKILGKAEYIEGTLVLVLTKKNSTKDQFSTSSYKELVVKISGKKQLVPVLIRALWPVRFELTTSLLRITSPNTSPLSHVCLY